MDIRVLNYFVTIVQQKNITHAAENLHVTQPTLSRQIKELEEELDVILFYRGSREIQLTEEGQYLYNRAKEILTLVNQTQDNLLRKDEISGELFIGTAESPSLDTIAKAAKHMILDYPQVRFNFHSGNADSILERLDKGLLDFGIVFGQVDTKKYNTLSLLNRDKWGILVPIDHPLGVKEQVTFSEIIDYPLIVSSQSNVDRTVLAGLGDYHIVASYNLLYNASLLVEAGLGIAVCLDGIVKTNQTQFIPLVTRTNTPDSLSLIWKRYISPSQTAKVFLEEVKNQLNVSKDVLD